MTVTFGVIGLGGRDKTVYGDLELLDWLSLEATCDTNEEHLNECADEFGSEKRFTRYEYLIQTDVDFVFIVTPPAHHAAMSTCVVRLRHYQLVYEPSRRCQ